MDNKYFVAINYVGVQGILMDRIDFGLSKKFSTNFEELKESDNQS